MTKLQIFLHKVMSFRALDSLCIFLVLCGLLYELPASAMAAIGASFGYFDTGIFYSYRLNFSAMVIGICSLNLIVNHRYLFKNFYFLLYVFFLLYMTYIVWINREVYGLETSTDTESVSALSFHLPILFKFCLFFFVGLFLPRLYRYKEILLLALITTLCVIIAFVDLETMGIDTKNYIDRKFLGNYLFIGDATSIIALICIAFFKSTKTKLIFTAFCIVTIFFIGSRTSFAVFAATVLLYFIVSFRPRFLFASVIVIVAASFALSSIDYAELEARNSRMFGVLVDYQSDRSVIGREEFAGYGWEEISNNIVMGNFGGQLSSGPPGVTTAWRYYMHNVFSYWRQFGILALIIVIVFTTRYFAILFKHRDKRNQSVFALYFLLGLFICVESTFSRSFAFPYTHIFFGLAVAISYTITSTSKQQSSSTNYYQLKRFDSSRPTKVRRKRKRRKTKHMSF